MTNVKIQRRIASELMKCGVNRVWVDPNSETVLTISNALTRQDIGKLIKSGTIKKRRVIGTSRRKARASHFKIKRGQRRGTGSRKGTQNARNNKKKVWINKIRSQRRYLTKLRAEGYITRRNYQILYKQAKGNSFRSVRYLSNVIVERKLEEKTLPQYKSR